MMLRRMMMAGAAAITPPSDGVWPSPGALPVTAGLVARYAAESLVLSDGAPVASWPDSSGNSLDLSQATSARQPAFRSTGFNGRPAVEFDGTDDAMQRSFGTTFPQPCTVVLLCSLPPGGAVYSDAYPWIDGASSSGRLWMGHTTALGRGGFWAGSSFISGDTLTEGPHVYRALYSGASSTFAGDGQQQAAGNPGSNGISGITLGARWDLLRNTKVLVNEVLVYSRALTPLEIADVDRYALLKARQAPILTIGPSLGPSNKYAYGTLASNGCVYATPFQVNNAAKIDPATGAVTTFGSFGSGNNSWIGMIAAPNGHLYCIPGRYNGCLKIDPATDTGTIIPVAAYNEFYGGALVGTKIYCAPFSQDRVLVIDTADDSSYTINGVTTTTSDSNGLWGWFTRSSVNGKLYASPRAESSILVVDPATDALSYITTGIPAGNRKYTGGIEDQAGNIWLIPRNAETILVIDPRTDTVRQVGTLPAGVDKWNGGTRIGRYIFMYPRQGRQVLRVDTLTDQVDYLPALLNSASKFVGSVDAGGASYLIPYAAQQVARILHSDLPA